MSLFTFIESPDIMVKMSSNDIFEHVFKVHFVESLLFAEIWHEMYWLI